MSERTNDSSLAELFKYSQNKNDVILHCTEWLKGFASWENFVEQNYMQSFLLPDGRPKRFFPNHTLEYGLPKTVDEYEEFFKNAVLCIKKRGDDIDKCFFNARLKMKAYLKSRFIEFQEDTYKGTDRFTMLYRGYEKSPDKVLLNYINASIWS